jgi:hypothetical protein
MLLRVAQVCEYEDPSSGEGCAAEAAWVADVGWSGEPGGAVATSYQGTDWNVALCDAHYELLRVADRITGTAHRVADG